MADIIQLLPEHVANQIAAGEVVQRPASVVKELLENAIDASASTIKLIIKDGGKTLIQVVDNGNGMSPIDARLSFERHATSKLKTAEDLFNIKTKGFRGEALASIAAIAHVEMLTKPVGEELGIRIRLEGGKVVFQEPSATPEGTSVVVKNLFFNIPARRNFLKSDNVEMRHILDEFHRIALAHPGIRFHCFSNGSEIFNLPEAPIRQRIVHIFGNKMNEKLVPLSEETEILKISGFICKPEFARKSRGEQFFFVNNRFIKSPYLHHAVMNAFEGLIKPGTLPGYFIFMEVDPGSIDVNIHPTKTEIKFDDEQTVYAIMRSAIKHSLGQFNVAPILDFDKDPSLETPYAFKNSPGYLPGISVDKEFNPFQANTATRPGEFKRDKRAAASWNQLYSGLDKGSEGDISPEDLQVTSEAITGSIFSETDTSEAEKIQAFQLKNKYIVTSIKSGMLIIDQQRAHQRVLYEKLLHMLTGHQTVSQQLLFPLKLAFNSRDMELIEQIEDPLKALGFIFGEKENDQIAINAIPVLVPESEVGTILDQVLDEWRQSGASSLSQADLLAKCLCKSLSIKKGDQLDQESLIVLVNDLFACKESALSPFNRTVYVTIPGEEIDKKFS